MHQVAAHRASLTAREAWTVRVGWVLPGVAAQELLHRPADTDLAAPMAYQDSIVAFHTRLRQFFYPYLFHDRPNTARAGTASWPVLPSLALLLAATIALLAGRRQARRLDIATG